MESVEVWMWLIAGIMLGGIIFVTAFIFLGHYTHNVEVSQAQDSFAMLKTTVDNACLGGMYNQEIDTFVFPYVLEKIYAQDEHEIKGSGNELCIEIQGELPYCEQTQICTVNMKSVDIQREKSVFYLIQKAMGKRQPANIRFTVSKVNKTELNITWKQVLE